MIKMHNGAHVLRADLRWDGPGTVLADSGPDYVIWTVEQDDQGVWHAFNGAYFPKRTTGRDPNRVIRAYDARRSGESIATTF